MKIYKYSLMVTDQQSIRMPKGASILDIQVQDGIPVIWASIPDHKFGEMGLDKFRTLMTFGTGHQITDETNLEYIGTYQLGGFVGHVFERTD